MITGRLAGRCQFATGEYMNMQILLESKLATAFAVAHLQIENESHKHNVPPGSESHFRVVMVSDDFTGKSLLARHRAVYGAVQAELAGGIRALALHTYTLGEWLQINGSAPVSPPCRGGGK